MTYMSNDLFRLCRNWCPLIDQCPEGHYCKYMDIIRRQVIKISDFNQFEKAINDKD